MEHQALLARKNEISMQIVHSAFRRWLHADDDSGVAKIRLPNAQWSQLWRALVESKMRPSDRGAADQEVHSLLGDWQSCSFVSSSE